VPMNRTSWHCATVRLAAAMLSIAAPLCVAHDLTAPPAPQHHSGSRWLTATAHYTIPAVQLVRDDGKRVALPEEMDDGRPVVLNFIYTSCSSVCPLASQVFEQFAAKLGSDRDTVHLMSISIDPEQDTPARLREYAQKFHAGPEWQHYTGSIEASLAAQRAFGVYFGDKMSHAPVTLVRIAPGMPWTRIDGLVTPDELFGEYRRLLGQTRDAIATR
jgi:protein SCO1